MFGWSKTPDNSGKKSVTNKTGSLDLGSLGIEGLDGLDIPLNDDFNDADLNDPELLGELDALGLGIQKDKPKPKPKPQPKPPPKQKSNPITSIPDDIDIDSINAMGAEVDEDPEVELTEEDMNDPNLLKELHGLGGHQSEDKNYNIKQTTTVVLQETQTKVDVDDQEYSEQQIVEERSIEIKLQSNDVNVLAKYIQEEKSNAVMKKRLGDKAGAIESMKAYKQLEAKRTKLLSQVSETENVHVKQQVSSSSSIQQKLEISSRNQEIIINLSTRFKQYKEAAIKFRDSDSQRAKEFFNTATIIHKTMKSLENGDELPEGWKIPDEPDESQGETVPQKAPENVTPVSTPRKKVLTAVNNSVNTSVSENITPVSTPKKKVLTVVDNAANTGVINDYEQPFNTISKEDQYARLISQLESQVALCTTISAYYLKTGDKTQAATFYRYKKSFAADLTSLTSYRMHDKSVPAFHFQDITYNVENAFLELSANDMEVCVIRAYNLSHKEVNGKDVDAYVSWDIGWPTEGSPGAGSGKGDTSTAPRGMDPEFNWKKVISIERTKAFQRHLSSKKATFEVFHYKGFLRKPISLGKATVKLDPLINKAEIHQVLDLVDNIRRPTGGKLEIRLRMRTPLVNPDIVSKIEKWLIIDEFNFNNPIFTKLQASTSAPATPATPARNTLQSDSITSTPMTPPPPPQTPVKTKVASVTSTPKPPPTPSTPTSVRSENPSQISTPVSRQKATPHKTVAAATQGRDTVSTSDEQSELEKAEEQLNNVDLLVSNLVIQHEVDTVNAQIATLEAQRKSIPDELMDRKNALDIKQNLLVIQVQTGQLTMDKYLDQVRASIISFKKLALVFKKAGKLKEAKKALGRSKIMEGEVKEVEEAMASGAMEQGE